MSNSRMNPLSNAVRRMRPHVCVLVIEAASVPPYLEVYTGTEILAEAFGRDTYQPKHAMPTRDTLSTAQPRLGESKRRNSRT